MFGLSDTWVDLLTLSGLLNPLAILIGLALGWKADQAAKIWIAGFAAAALSLMAETAWSFTGLPQPIDQDAGALAMFPFRFASGAVVCAIVMLMRRRMA
ncbi:hypothetical protein GCM10011316_33740 [Roseibium aquae]|uniref:Uncharacterized protein n=1 Tax=Roseibium aquae TaxID=1323746 RepID=A0A916X2Z3_9HYPH|nr:phosphatidylglycerophosphatase [Roseibium aquae]GGB58944.1 hypothetical protein GCM10011316_33740 [Roseibium aquae]